MKKIFVLFMALMLAGCANRMMQHPTKTSIDIDNYGCRIEAEQRAANWGAQGNVFMINDWHFECLEHRGWTYVKE